MLNAVEIVGDLGGTNAAARFFGVQPPSVSEWVKKGEIPEDKLIRKAATLEKQLPRFHRRSQWPETYHEIWPELAPMPAASAVGSGV
jgi:hypothetical protein